MPTSSAAARTRVAAPAAGPATARSRSIRTLDAERLQVEPDLVPHPQNPFHNPLAVDEGAVARPQVRYQEPSLAQFQPRVSTRHAFGRNPEFTTGVATDDMAARNLERFPLADQAPASARGGRLHLCHGAKHLGGAPAFGVDNLRFDRSEGHPVPGSKLLAPVDPPAVDTGAVGAPEIDQIDAVRLAMDLGVIAGDIAGVEHHRIGALPADGDSALIEVDSVVTFL